MMNKNFVELAQRLDDFMYDYDYYGYADDVGISPEERTEHREHLADALRNNEFSPMIDTLRDIIKEEMLDNKGDAVHLNQAKGLLKDLTELSKDFAKIEPWSPTKAKTKEQTKIKNHDDLNR